MTVVDPAFEAVGQGTGLEIWRVEDFQVKAVPKSEYGNFYCGDSYIVLSTKESRSGRLEWDIHFWLGEETSQDEAGTAAIKSVELDDALGGGPVQHREVQGHESPLFLSYFKTGIRYLQGGVKSGFHHVEDVVVKRLLRVKGRRNVRLHEMPLEVGSLNQGDCFVLDAGPSVFVLVGPRSGRMERIKAVQAANALRDDVHCGRSQVKIVDDSSSGSEVSEFFEELGGGSLDQVADEGEVDDQAFETDFEAITALYKIWENNSGELEVELVSEKPLQQTNLDSNDCFLLDGGLNGLFVWIGRDSSPKERREAMILANKFIEKKSYPKWLHCKRIVEGAEPPLFKSYFSVWKEPLIYSSELSADCCDSEEVTKRHSLHAKSGGSVCSFMPDDGSGEAEVWRVCNFDIVPVEPSQKGIFFGGDSYIIKYTYQNPGYCYILYFWLGQSSSLDEKATAAIMTVKMDNDIGGKATQVRVVQGQEPEHFLRVFRGRMVTLSGGHASGFKNIHDFDSYDADGTRLFQVRGTNDFNTRAEQVQESSTSLNSNDVFILETPSTTFLWIGKSSTEEEHKMGRQLTGIVSPNREVLEVAEGEEPGEFWSALGGKEAYPATRDLPSHPHLEPRLFKVSNSSGRVRMEEICNFTQEDLSEDDVMILDIGDAVYIWIGSGSDEEEKSESLKMAESYVNSDPTYRSGNSTVIFTVKQGEEPETFRLFFGGWNPQLWQELASLIPTH